jgi:DNA-binding LacI/PurR family transcriptional regulator/PAS domain-containing protein
MHESQESLTFRSETYNLGVFSPVVGGFYFGKLLAGVAVAARGHGHRITAVQTFEADLDRGRFPESSQRTDVPAFRHLDGHIIVTTALGGAALQELRESGAPIVCVGNVDPTHKVPTVSPDNRGGARAAIEHLVAHGHTAISFVGNIAQFDVRERFEEYRTALAEHGMDFQESLVFFTADNQEESGYQAGREWLKRTVRSSATFAATDRNAIGFMRALHEADLVLPRDHAIIAFDHSEAGSRVRPRLSSVDPHHDRVGELAVGLVLSQLDNECVTTGAHTVPFTLVTRESCGCFEDTPAPRYPVAAGERTTADPFDRLLETAHTVFSGFGATWTAAHYPSALHIGSWHGMITELVRKAVGRGAVPSAQGLARITDITAALHPHPEAIERLLTVLREIEQELDDRDSTKYRGALHATMTKISVAVAKGCTKELLGRTGVLERNLANQYEIDLALMRVEASNPRTLSWLPGSFRGGAALALWSGNHGAIERELEVVGTRGVGSAGSRLIGARFSAQHFPPPNLSRALCGPRHDIVFVIPVTFAGSDWGLLALAGMADSHSTSARDRFNHWAAMLAVALDHEKRLDDLREQQLSVLELASTREELTQAMRHSEERFALASAATYEGMWDWDVVTGRVYYSPQWCGTLKLDPITIEPNLDSWMRRVHPEDIRDMQAAIAQQLAGIPALFHLDQRVNAGDGTWVRIEVRGQTLVNDAGIPARVIGALTTVTPYAPDTGLGEREADNAESSAN